MIQESSEMTLPIHVAAVSEPEAQAAAKVIRPEWLRFCQRMFEFERQFATQIAARHAIAISSTQRRILALEAMGIKSGDAVLNKHYGLKLVGHARS
jgi:dTDP-4-amino-4,6-dideoxygalactose transaminase